MWNARRILPGAYESLLTCLVRLFRQETVALFVEMEAHAEEGNGVPLSAGAQQDFRRRLNQAWGDALPPPLGELIEAHVAELDIDTYYDLDARSQQIKLRQKQRLHPFRLKQDLDKIRKRIQAVVLEWEPEIAEDDRGEESVTEREDVRGSLVKCVTKARGFIIRGATTAVNVVNNLCRNAENENRSERIASMFGAVQDKMAESHRAFEAEVERRFREIHEALNSLRELSADFDDDDE